LAGIAGIIRGNMRYATVEGVIIIALEKNDRYFNLLARVETVGLDLNHDGVVVSLLDESDMR